MTSTSSTAAKLGLLGLLGLLGGCGIVISGEEVGDEDTLAEDIAEYEALVAELEQDRELALAEDASASSSSGPWLAWIADAKLGLRRDPDLLELELPAPSVGFRLSEAHLLTADSSDAGVVFRGYALPEIEPIDEQTIVGARSSFALWREQAFVIDDAEVWSWTLGVGAPVVVGGLAELGIEAPTIKDFVVVVADVYSVGERLLIHAGDLLYVIELATWSVEAVEEIDELLSADMDAMLFHRAGGLYYEYYSYDEPVRIDAEIAASGWSLNPTFANIHEYTGDGAVADGERVFYIGRAGLFAYYVGEGRFGLEPILLEPRWDVGAGIARIEYREPVVGGGRVFVRGLTGPSGEVGTTGPIYAMTL